MTRTQIRKYAVAILVLTVALAGRSSGAQEKPAPPPKPLIPLQVTVVISRYQGERAEKRTSSLPFTLRVNGNDRPSNLRMGAEVPVPVTTFGQKEGGGPATPVTSYQLRSVGTNIDCSAEVLDGGAYALTLTISDSQVQPSPGSATSAMPLSFQSFSSNHRLVIRDGQTIQQTAATDKSTGETVKVDVTLNVVK